MPDPIINNRAVPESTNALLLKANAAMNRERYDQAVALCQQILEQNSDEVNALKLLSLSLWKQGQLNSAVLQASYLLELYPEDADAYYIMGAVLYELGRFDAAAAALREAMRLNPDLHAALDSYALLLQTQGDTAAAVQIYEALLAFDARQGSRWLAYVSTQAFAKGAPPFKQLQQQFKRSDLAKRDRAQMQFALAKLYENTEAYTQAFRAYQAGNRLRAEQEREAVQSIRSGQLIDQAQQLIQAFTPECLVEREGWTEPLRDTTLILGPPGSGKSLLSAALNAHPQIQSYAELNILAEAWAQFDTDLSGDDPLSSLALEPEALYHLSELLDAAWGEPPQPDTAAHLLTYPEHIVHVGSLCLLNPNTRLVVCERDPLATGLVIYMRWLHQRQPYAWSMATIADYVWVYRRLVDHWQHLWPEQVYRVAYTDVVARPDECVAELLAWLGVGWDPACADVQGAVIDPQQIGLAGRSLCRARMNPDFAQLTTVYREAVPLMQRALDEAEQRVAAVLG
jgi:tetratricopeptide (TPR) repeat protein